MVWPDEPTQQVPVGVRHLRAPVPFVTSTTTCLTASPKRSPLAWPTSWRSVSSRPSPARTCPAPAALPPTTVWPADACLIPPCPLCPTCRKADSGDVRSLRSPRSHIRRPTGLAFHVPHCCTAALPQRKFIRRGSACECRSRYGIRFAPASKIPVAEHQIPRWPRHATQVGYPLTMTSARHPQLICTFLYFPA